MAGDEQTGPNSVEELDPTGESPRTESETSEAAQDATVETIEDLRRQMESLEERALRARADYINLERRIAAQHAEAVRYGNTDILRALIDVVDDLERSIAAAAEAQDTAAIIEGERLIHTKLWGVLQRFGLELIESDGKTFDPKQHEALMQQPSAEAAPGTVLHTVAKGYRLHDRVLRPARVIVAKQAEESAATGGASESGE